MDLPPIQIQGPFRENCMDLMHRGWSYGVVRPHTPLGTGEALAGVMCTMFALYMDQAALSSLDVGVVVS